MAFLDGHESGIPLSNDEDVSKPLWKYVTRYQKLNDGGGNISWRCNFCHQMKKSSYTRVKAHLLRLRGCGIRGCPGVTAKDLEEMRKLECEVKMRKTGNVEMELPLATASAPLANIASFVQEDCAVKKRKMDENGSDNESSSDPIAKALTKMVHDQLDAEISRMFYSAGLPFQLARNPYFINSFTFAANHQISDYVPPDCNALTTTLLQQEKEKIQKSFHVVKHTWKEKGVSIVSDGWSDPQQRPLINVMAVWEGGPMFLRAVDNSEDTKDKYFISNLMKEVIEEIGPSNVVQVITDNTKACEDAVALIQETYPHIFWTPCIVHALNHALQIICTGKNVEHGEVLYEEFHWIREISNDVLSIKSFIVSHSMRSDIFKQFSPLKLLLVANSRFASILVVMKRFKLLKEGLLAMVTDEQWKYYRQDDEEKAEFVKEKVLDDTWWDKIDYILSFTAPIYDMIRVCSMDKECLHLVYDMWSNMIENVKIAIYENQNKRLEEMSTLHDVVYEILTSCWNNNKTPLYSLAHSLNPRCYTNQWLEEKPNRVAPHKNLQVSEERLTCMERYFSNQEIRTNANVEFANFVSMSKDVFRGHAMDDCYDMDPRCWWIIHGLRAPVLQQLALKLLAQPCCSSCCERNWSTYSFMHSLKKEKLNPKLAEDLMYVHTNLRLLSRDNSVYMQGESKMWDIYGDGFGLFEGVRELEIAHLSLDEPELESVVFLDDDGTRSKMGVGNDETTKFSQLMLENILS